MGKLWAGLGGQSLCSWRVYERRLEVRPLRTHKDFSFYSESCGSHWRVFSRAMKLISGFSKMPGCCVENGSKRPQRKQGPAGR